MPYKKILLQAVTCWGILSAATDPIHASVGIRSEAVSASDATTVSDVEGLALRFAKPADLSLVEHLQASLRRAETIALSGNEFMKSAIDQELAYIVGGKYGNLPWEEESITLAAKAIVLLRRCNPFLIDTLPAYYSGIPDWEARLGEKTFQQGVQMMWSVDALAACVSLVPSVHKRLLDGDLDAAVDDDSWNQIYATGLALQPQMTPTQDFLSSEILRGAIAGIWPFIAGTIKRIDHITPPKICDGDIEKFMTHVGKGSFEWVNGWKVGGLHSGGLGKFVQWVAENPEFRALCSHKVIGSTSHFFRPLSHYGISKSAFTGDDSAEAARIIVVPVAFVNPLTEEQGMITFFKTDISADCMPLVSQVSPDDLGLRARLLMNEMQKRYVLAMAMNIHEKTVPQLARHSLAATGAVAAEAHAGTASVEMATTAVLGMHAVRATAGESGARVREGLISLAALNIPYFQVGLARDLREGVYGSKAPEAAKDLLQVAAQGGSFEGAHEFVRFVFKDSERLDAQTKRIAQSIANLWWLHDDPVVGSMYPRMVAEGTCDAADPERAERLLEALDASYLQRDKTGVMALAVAQFDIDLALARDPALIRERLATARAELTALEAGEADLDRISALEESL